MNGSFICAISERDWALARRLGVYGNKTGHLRDGNYHEFRLQTKYSIIRDLLGMRVGDIVFFHVISPSGSRIHGPYKVRNTPFHSDIKIWNDAHELFPYRFLFEPYPDFSYLCDPDTFIYVTDLYELIERRQIWSLATLENERNIEARSVRKITSGEETNEILRLLHRDFRHNYIIYKEPIRLMGIDEFDRYKHLLDCLGHIGRYENSIKAFMMYNLAFSPVKIAPEFKNISDFINEVFIAQTTRKSIDILCINTKETGQKEYVIFEVKTDRCDKSSLSQLLYYADLFRRNHASEGESTTVSGRLVGKRFDPDVQEFSRMHKEINKNDELALIKYIPSEDGKTAEFKIVS